MFPEARIEACSRRSRTNPIIHALELEILELWEREQTFAQLRDRNRGNERWSFVDGPVTANRPSLGVHTAWGRTLKDVFQRYKGLRGFDQRYQNGFDCQGLWIEVGVERELGLNSKREIEEYGLEEFARKCRDVVVRSSAALTRGSKRLGQWMDWGSDYFTFSDTNIEYIWKFLSIVHERGWLYMGHRSTEWCPRCGTSLSQHELTQSGVYQDRADPSLFVRFPLLDRDGEYVVVWTTTPWTLPANVAAAVHPDEEYGRRENGEWVAVKLFPADTFTERLRGSDLVGWRYRGPFDDLAPGSEVEHRVIPWDDVTMDQGTGIVHIAPGCGGEDFELSKVHELAGPDAGRRVGPVLRRLRLAARALDDRGRRPDHRPARRDRLPRRSRALHPRLSALLAVRHAVDLPALRRLVHLGGSDSGAAARGEREGAVGPRVHGQAHGRLAAQHGRLEHLASPVLRAAAAVLSVLVRPPDRRRLEVGAARARDGRLRPARGAAPAVGRPRADPLRRLRRDGHPDPGGRRRLARCGHRSVRDARLGERGVGDRGLRDRSCPWV